MPDSRQRCSCQAQRRAGKQAPRQPHLPLPTLRGRTGKMRAESAFVGHYHSMLVCLLQVQADCCSSFPPRTCSKEGAAHKQRRIDNLLGRQREGGGAQRRGRPAQNNKTPLELMVAHGCKQALQPGRTMAQWHTQHGLARLRRRYWKVGTVIASAPPITKARDGSQAGTKGDRNLRRTGRGESKWSSGRQPWAGAACAAWQLPRPALAQGDHARLATSTPPAAFAPDDFGWAAHAAQGQARSKDGSAGKFRRLSQQRLAARAAVRGHAPQQRQRRQAAAQQRRRQLPLVATHQGQGGGACWVHAHSRQAAGHCCSGHA